VAVYARVRALGDALYEVACDVVPDPDGAETGGVVIALRGETTPAIADRLEVVRARIERATLPTSAAGWIPLR
jgi:hypothetical protein